MRLKRNFTRWPIDSKWYFDGNDYKQELNLMQDFVEIRIDQLDEYFHTL